MAGTRKSSLLLAALSLALLLFTATLIDADLRRDRAGAELELLGQTVKDLQLTDLSLFTEARYTRHPSQADRFSAFQDHPLALEHFPSGSLMMPPAGLRGSP